MCKDCGCGEADGHDHEHEHLHDHDHIHAHAPRVLEVRARVLARNDEAAARTRRLLDARGIVALNLVSSPGSGKTTLLERTLDRLRDRLPCAVITGDLATDNDRRRLAGRGAPVSQIETRSACHLNAEQVEGCLPEVLGDGARLLFIENVGNLVCPAAFDLGERSKVALLSVTEGEDKPLKYPVVFSQAPLTVVTKIDLLPHVDWNREACHRAIRGVRPDAGIIELSARTGEGMEDWIGYLEALVPQEQP